MQMSEPTEMKTGYMMEFKGYRRATGPLFKPRKVILDLCGGSGSWGKPYVEAGYDVRVVSLPWEDIMHTRFIGDMIIFYRDKNHVGRNPTLLKISDVYGILAAPPCTEFSIAKNHTIKRDFKSGMEVVNKCLEIIEKCKPKFWALENPAGYLSKFLGDPYYSFQPWWFGDGWSKRTLLWGNFNIPQRHYDCFEDVPKIEGLYTRPGRKTPSIAFMHKNHKRFIRAFDPFEADSDAAFRAITSPAFARAFFIANQ